MKAEKETAKEKPMTARYHISRRENGQYAATLEGAGRASKLCSTQAQAIKSARKFSNNKSSGLFSFMLKGTEIIQPDRSEHQCK